MIVGDETPESHHFLIMTITAAEYAKHGIRKSGRQYIKDGQVLTSTELAALVGKKATRAKKNVGKPAPTEAWTFERLNATTQAFFYQLCEQILEATKDASATCGVQIGKDIPRIGLENAPRLTNLKRAGMFEHAGKGWLQLTEYGRAVFLATV